MRERASTVVDRPDPIAMTRSSSARPFGRSAEQRGLRLGPSLAVAVLGFFVVTPDALVVNVALAADLLHQPAGGRGRAVPPRPGLALAPSGGAVGLDRAGGRGPGDWRADLRADRGRRRGLRRAAGPEGAGPGGRRVGGVPNRPG